MYVGITGETYLITVISQASPAVIQQRTGCTVALHVAEQYIIKPPCIVQCLYMSVEHILLPVQPPEIYSFFSIGRRMVFSIHS